MFLQICYMEIDMINFVVYYQVNNFFLRFPYLPLQFVREKVVGMSVEEFEAWYRIEIEDLNRSKSAPPMTSWPPIGNPNRIAVWWNHDAYLWKEFGTFGIVKDGQSLFGLRTYPNAEISIWQKKPLSLLGS